MNRERRKHSRINVALHIELTDPARSKDIEGYTTNISPEGVFVTLYGESPSMDSEVDIHFKIWTGRENIFRRLGGRVVRSENSGVGLVFTENDLVTFAVVQDILHYQQFERRNRPRRFEPPRTPDDSPYAAAS